MSTQASFEDKT